VTAAAARSSASPSISIARAAEALQRLWDRTGDSETDSVNRAVLLYEYLEVITSHGGDVFVRESKASNQLQLVKLL
jgi:hypothetical protein